MMAQFESIESDWWDVMLMDETTVGIDPGYKEAIGLMGSDGELRLFKVSHLLALITAGIDKRLETTHAEP